MASTKNAFEMLLDGGIPAPVPKTKKKKGKASKANASEGGYGTTLEDVIAPPVRELEAGSSLDEFRPAVASRKGKAKEVRGSDAMTVIEAAALETRAALGARDAAELTKLWDGWSAKLAAFQSGEEGTQYRGGAGKMTDFKEVLLSSEALEASLEAAVASRLTPPAQAKLEGLLALVLPAEAQGLARLLPASILHLQGLLRTTNTPDVLQAARAAFSKVLAAAKSSALKESGDGDVASLISSLHREVEEAQQASAAATSTKEQSQLAEKAERLARKALDLASGNPTVGETDSLAEGRGALDNLAALITRRLSQAKVGASGFWDAVNKEVEDINQEQAKVQAEIKAAEQRLQDLRLRAAQLASNCEAAEAKAKNGPSSGELNVEAFEQQLAAVLCLQKAPAVCAVLEPAQSGRGSEAAIADAVGAHLRALEDLLVIYRNTQHEILGKAQSMAERLVQNKRRGEQLSLMTNMVDEQKRNAKLIETQAASLQELATQAKACVKRAVEAETSLQRGALLSSSAEIDAARNRIRGLLAELKSAEEDIAACVNPKLVKPTGRVADDPIVPTPSSSQHIMPVGSPAPKVAPRLAPPAQGEATGARRGPLIDPMDNGGAPLPVSLANGTANGHPEAHVTAHVALGAALDEKPLANGHLPNGKAKAHAAEDDGGFIAAGKRGRRNRRPAAAPVAVS